MTVWRMITVLVLCLALVGSMACNPFASSNQEEASQQLVKVVRGDLTVSVSGAGNIAVANEENLTFESSSGRVDKIYVRVGHKVNKGDVLAELAPLDTDALELSLTQAQIDLIQAQISLQTAEINLEKAQDLYKWPDIEIAQADVDDAKAYLQYALDNQGHGSGGDADVWDRVVRLAGAQLDNAEKRLNAMLTSADTDEVDIKKLQVEAAKVSLQRAQQSLVEAQEELENETITAPWDGVVASVGAEVGDTFHSSAAAGTVIVRLIDLTSLELPVQVDEIDIPKIKLNQSAVVSIDALPDVKLEGSVITISPVPAEKSGVVLYDVTIGLTVPEDIDLKIGMSATANIIIEKRSNVLLVPSQAIKQDRRGNSIVMIQDGEQLQPKPVVTGISVGLLTEIVDGLGEGETVVIEMPAETEPSGRPSGLPGLFHREPPPPPPPPTRP